MIYIVYHVNQEKMYKYKNDVIRVKIAHNTRIYTRI